MWYKFITSYYDIYNYYYNNSLVIYLTDINSYSGKDVYLYKVFSNEGDISGFGSAKTLEEAKFKSLLKAKELGWDISDFNLKNNIDYSEVKHVASKK